MSSRDPADREGPPRLHRHLPEVDAADLAQHALDEVVVADRHAARGEHDVRGARRPGADVPGGARARRARSRGRAGRRRPPRPCRRARSGSRRRSARAAGAGRAPPPRRRSRATPRADGACTPISAKPSDARRPRSCGRRTDPAVSTTAPARTSSPRARTFAPRSTVASSTQLSRALAELLRHDGVRPARHGRAGHDPERLAGSDPALVHRSGGKIATTRRRTRRPGARSAGLQGVAVHGGVVGGRDVEGGRDVAGQDAAEAARHWQRLRGAAPATSARMRALAVRDWDHGGDRYYTGWAVL